MLRYSGTEMIARVMVESNDEKVTQDYAHQMAQEIQKRLGATAQ